MQETFDLLVDHLVERGFFLEEAVEIMERTLIARALARTGWNRSAASKLLGIHRNTLQKKIVDFKLEQKPRKAVNGAAGMAAAGS